MSYNTINENNPMDDVSIRNMDNKSHSKTYLKQVEKRNQKLADAINQLPGKLKKKLEGDVPVTSTPAVDCKKNKVRPTAVMFNNYMQDLHDDDDAIADAKNDIADAADEDAQLLKDAKYAALVDVEYLDRLLRAQVGYALDVYDAAEECNDSEDEYSDIVSIMFPENDDHESVEEEAFIIHGRNLAALAKYYKDVVEYPCLADAEYEFWLTFEIKSFEDGSRDIIDVEEKHYYQKDAEDYMVDEYDEREREIEYRTADAIEDDY